VSCLVSSVLAYTIQTHLNSLTGYRLYLIIHSSEDGFPNAFVCVDIKFCSHITLSSPVYNITFILLVSSTSLMDCTCHCNLEIFVIIPYILESNPHPFYSFGGLKIRCRLDLRQRAGFWKNDRATVRAVRTIQ
jgi:hypothetical protein